MLKLREEQLIQERRRQEKLREEAQILRRQEEEIRRRQEEIAQELLQSDQVMKKTSVAGQDAGEVMVCQAREGQVFVGRKPHYTETVLDRNVVDVQALNTSDWDSTSDAESVLPGVLKKSYSTVSNKSNSYRSVSIS